MKNSVLMLLAVALVILLAGTAYSTPISPKALEDARRDMLPLSDALFAPPPAHVDAPDPIPPMGHSGAYKVLIICIQFTDSTQTYSTASFSNMAFGPWATGSINDYYTEISYSNLTLSGNVYGWYTASQGRDYYGAGAKGWGTYPQNTGKLVEEAVDAAELAGCDFSQYDNDGDGEAESIFICHSHEGCETSLNANDIQSHVSRISQMGGTARVYDGVTVDRYACVAELQSTSPLKHVEIGVWCHEYGHILGLPDLYDVGRWCTGTMGWGIGAWGLMSFGGWGGDVVSPHSPAHMCGWSKIQMGWVNPGLVWVTPGSVATLFRLEDNAHVFKIGMDMQHTEYFLVELRDSAYGFDRSLVKRGVLIYHVDDDQWMENDCENGSGCPSSWDLMVALEQPDGSYHLDCGTAFNYGDRGDMYPYGSAQFSPTSTPNSNTNEGTSSGVTVKNFLVSSTGLWADLFMEGRPLLPQCAYDDNDSDQLFRWGAANSGFAVRVTPARHPAWVRGVRVMIGDPSYPYFQCQVWSDSGGVPGHALTPVHTMNPATTYEWNYVDVTSDSVIVTSGDFWAVYIEYNNSQICADYDPPWSGRTMYYYMGNFWPDTYQRNYMIRAVYDTLYCAGTPEVAAGELIVSANPNPFRQETSLSFTLDQRGRVAIAVYDITGRRVRQLADSPFEAGRHSVAWDGTDSHGEQVCSGIYFYRLTSGTRSHTGKITLLR